MTLEPLAVRPSEQILLDALDEMHGRELLCTSLGRAPGRRCCGRVASRQARHLLVPRPLSGGSGPGAPPRRAGKPDHPLSARPAGYRAGFGGDSHHGRRRCRVDTRDHARGTPGTANRRADARGDRQSPRHVAGRRNAQALRSRNPPAEGPGALYLATKTRPLAKLKNFTCEFVFRDRQRLIRAVSRPGVFAHRRVDPGARALMEVMEIEPGARVLDMGCGSGTVALAAVVRASGGERPRHRLEPAGG